MTASEMDIDRVRATEEERGGRDEPAERIKRRKISREQRTVFWAVIVSRDHLLGL